MNGVHDLGGMHGFGPVDAEPEGHEPAFHADWEKTVYGLFNTLLPLRRWSLDRFRKMIESQPAVDYLRHSYYENWFASLTALSKDSGLVEADELAAAEQATAATGPTSPAVHDRQAWMGEWAPIFDDAAAPRYGAGDRVRSRNRHPVAHTRQPRYVRGKVGVVVAHVGAEPLPEHAAENVCVPQHLYRVRFEATELWGATVTSRDAVYIELWEEYLEPAS